nr:UBN2 domain-containing protein [Tanacetum cinerariifolium]
NSQAKDNKIDLLVQQYEQFTILEEESIDSGFARFNTVITSLKAIDEGFSSKNYVRKFIRALHPKWRAKVITIGELKDLSSLALAELIGNLKVHKLVMEKDSEIYKGKKERVKSITLKSKKKSSDDETSTSGSDNEEYAMAMRNFKKFFRRKSRFVRCGDPNHLIGEFSKPQRNKDQKAFVGAKLELGSSELCLNPTRAKLRLEWLKLNEQSSPVRAKLLFLEPSSSLVELGLGSARLHPWLEVLGAIAMMKPRTKPIMKLVSWLNRQMR